MENQVVNTQDTNSQALAKAIREHFTAFDRIEGEGEAALAFRWTGAAVAAGASSTLIAVTSVARGPASGQRPNKSAVLGYLKSGGESLRRHHFKNREKSRFFRL